MKTHIKNSSLTILSVLFLGFYFTSCKKSSSTIAPPTPLGGYVSSDSVAPGNLIAYWPFDGNVNDVKGSTNATPVGVTYGTGVRGQAYQGGTGVYATLTPSSAFSNLQSYSFSVWYKLPSQQPAGDPGGIFFLAGDTTLNYLIYEIEPYSPASGDSVKVHHGFTDLASPGAYKGFTMESFDTAAIGKWVHLVTTYDGASSTYTIYQNGVPINNSSAFGNTTPTQMWSDGTKTTPLGNLGFSQTDPPKSIIIGTWPATLYGVSPTLGAKGCFIGQLDEMRIYNKALSSAEVQGLYLNGQAGR